MNKGCVMSDADRSRVWNLPQPRPVAEAILGYRPRGRNRVHLTGRYSLAFEGFPLLAVRVLGMGADSLVIELTDGTVLSICNKLLGPDFGQRPYDLPVLEVGTRSAGSDTFHYFIRPKARSPVTWQEYQAFLASLPEGHLLMDAKLSNVGEYNGKLYLVDPFAVTVYGSRRGRPGEEATWG